MRILRIFPVLLAGAMACRDAPERERAAEPSPYGRLEVARAEEEPPRAVEESPRAEREAQHPDSSPRRRSLPDRAAVPPTPASPSDTGEPLGTAELPDTAEPPNTSELPDSAERPETAVPPNTGEPPDTATPPDTAGYTPYPADPPLDTVAAELPDTAVVPPETVPDPVASPDPAPRASERTVPAGTTLHAALEDSIHSRIDVPGKVVAAKVMQSVTAPDGRTLVPAGTPVLLTVTQVKPGRGERKGVLEIRADSITLGGDTRKLEARLEPVPHELRGRGVTGEDAAKVGVGAAGGAVVGRVIGGDTRGAVIGGVVGAAGGAVVASETAAKDVVVKARTPFVLVLTAPLPAGS
jgi:hypothetical protein